MMLLEWQCGSSINVPSPSSPPADLVISLKQHFKHKITGKSVNDFFDRNGIEPQIFGKGALCLV
jgi:hypothetical protein